MHEGHRQRLKQRFLSEGLSSFEDHEVLELLLFYTMPQGDTNPLAHRLINHFHTLDGVFGADVEELCKIQGVREHTAIFLKLVPQLSQFYTSLCVRDKKMLVTTHDAGEYVSKKIGCLSNEVFALICLDSQRRVLAFEIIDEGTVSQANVHPRKVVSTALRHNSAAVILAHNHPSGTMQASENDRILTQKLCDVLEAVGIHVIDHIIAASTDKYYSMSDHFIMPN